MDYKNTVKLHTILTVLTLVILLLPLSQGDFFGSEGDWYSQHVGAAENLRQTMLNTGSLFPQFSTGGGGCNIYDLAYYGLLRPDVLFSCLVPNLEMKYIIAGYALLGAIASVNLCYIWLRRQKLAQWVAFCGSVLLAAAACFYHAHHQIIFINYMPFLILALMGIDKLLEKGKVSLMAVSLFLVYMHSFFYAFSCLVVCLVYFLYKSNWRPDIKSFGKAVLAVTISIGMAAVLLLPTALNILSTTKDAGGFMSQPMDMVDLKLGGLLYYPYGCGLSLLALYCLLLSLCKKRRRILSVILLICILVPAVSLVLNGFLYPRAKILIPFVPLIVMLCTDTLQELFEKKQKWMIVPAVLCFLPAAFSPWKDLMLIDGGILLAWVLVQRFLLKSERAKKSAFVLILLVPIMVSIGVNKEEDYLRADDDRQSHFTSAEIRAAVTDLRYRFDVLANNYVNSNTLPGGGINKTAMYSSIENKLYADFYYNVMGNPISLRNRVVLMPNQNSCFNYFMGIRYLLTDIHNIPYGYQAIAQKKDYVLAENKDVLPMCYGTDKLLSEDVYKDLVFPYNMEALCSQAVVEGRHGAKGFQSALTEQSPQELLAVDAGFTSEDGKTLSFKKAETLTLPLTKALKNQIMIIRFDVESKRGKEVIIEINGMRNNLSAESAPYPNENHTFTYVLSANEVMDKLEIEFSKGDYDISRLQVYTMDSDHLQRDDITLPSMTEGGKKDGKTVFAGSVEMENDGYFITSYPYRKGYQVFVDGKKASYEKVNAAFVGFPVSAGGHEIEIHYYAPGFKAGLAISILSMVVLCLIILKERKKAI